METITHHQPAGVYPAGPDYAHALELRAPSRLLLVAGTMGLDASGVAGASLEEQLELVWANVRSILAAAAMSVDDVVRVTSYLRNAAYAERNAAARVGRSSLVRILAMWRFTVNALMKRRSPISWLLMP